MCTRFTIAFFLPMLFATSLSTTANASEPYYCQGTQECGELANNMGALALSLGALMLPHSSVLFNTDSDPGKNIASIGIGEKNLKNMDLDLQSCFIANRNWKLNTRATFQLYDRTIPSVLKFGIGGGYQYKLDEFLYLTSLLKASVEKIESLDPLQIGPELDLKLNYVVNDKLTIITGLQTFFYSELDWKITLGVSNYRRKDQASAFSNLEILLGYEENRKLQTKIFSIYLARLY